MEPHPGGKAASTNMNGKRAKALRRMVYWTDVGGVIYKLDHRDREYEMVDPPKRHRSLNKTMIADEQRHLYQTLKGRRGLPAI